ncbi:MAG: tetratricopeptide repeat protein [Lachnospiraceae bacterium]|nr:tetratricopeptide repeat protein [Lachnospiraceae bacterium]
MDYDNRSNEKNNYILEEVFETNKAKRLSEERKRRIRSRYLRKQASKRRQKVAIAILITLLTAFLVIALNYKRHEAPKGLDYINAGKYEEALKCFEIDIKNSVNPADAWLGAGIAYYELKRYDEAEEALLKTIELGTKESAVIYNMLGSARFEEEKWDAALHYYEKALSVGDGSAELIKEVKFNEIVIYEKKEDYETAKEKLTKYIEEYPDDEKAAKEIEFLEILTN